MSTHANNIAKPTARPAKVQRKEGESEGKDKINANDTAFVGATGQGSLSAMHGAIQAKLNVGKPGDKFEQEADATAESVMSKPFVQKEAMPADDNLQTKSNTVQKEEQEIQQKTGDEETVNMESFWAEFRSANQPVPPPPVENTPSPLAGRSLLSAGGGEAKPKAVGGAAGAAKGAVAKPAAKTEEKVQKKEEESSSAPAISMATDEEKIGKKSFLQMMADEEQVQPKEEEQLSAKSFLQAELFDSDKDVPNDMLNAKEDEQVVSAKEDEPVVSAKEDEPVVSAKEENESGALSMKEDEPVAQAAEDEDVQAKEGSGNAGAAFESQLKSSKGSGSSMSPQLGSEMSSRFGGTDFSEVKIHTDSNAVDMNKQINAKAFTNQSDIYFNSGQFDSNSSKGKTLLAHELTHTVQQGAVDSGDKVQRSIIDDFVHQEDGDNPKARMHEEAEDESGEDIDFDMVASEEEKQEGREEVDHEEKAEQTGKISNKGIAKPDVDRPGKELPKVKQAANDGKQKMEETPEGGGDKKKEPAPARVDLAPVESKEASALAAYEQADKLKLPKERKPFKEPRIEVPVDQKGEPVPGDPANDKMVKTLHEIAKLLAENAFAMEGEAVNDEQESWKMRAVIDEGMSKVASTKAGTMLAKQDKAARDEINTAVEGSYEKNAENVALVKAEAPKMKEKAAAGQEKAGPMVEEAKEKKAEMKAEETEESGQEEKDQQADTNNVSEGSVEMDNAMAGAEAGAENYFQDAIKGEEKNNQAKANIDENKNTSQNTQGEIDRIDGENAASEAMLTEMDYYPEMAQQQTAQRAESAGQLYAAAQVMNDQLIDIQEEYYNTMKSEVPGAADAAKQLAEMEKQAEAEAEAEAEATTEEQGMLIEMAGMEGPELDEHLMTMDEEQLMSLQSTLDLMTTQEEEQEERDLAGRKKFDLEKALFGEDENAEEGPQDPRATWYQEVENRRGARLGEVKQLADVNFSHLSKDQKAMLSQKLAMTDAVSGLFDINIMDMGVGMIKGMLDPRESLKGVLNGANQMIGGFVNLFNAEAWAKDPLGNLLQSAADIATGLTTIFMSITGLAVAINILMTALTIASLGTMSWLTGPVIGFMTSVISTVGGWTVITGLIALELNALTYIKNLHDAGNAENTDELLFESDSMKQNMTDGFTSMMAVVGGKGSVKGANVMKNKIMQGGGSKAFMKMKGLKFKEALKRGGGKFKNFLKASGKGIKNLTVASISKVKNGIKNAIAKVKAGVTGGVNKFKKFFKKKDVAGEIKSTDGHTLTILKDGTCLKCSICKDFMKSFGGYIKKNPILKGRLKDLKARLKQNPKDKKLLEDVKRFENDVRKLVNSKRLPSKNGKWTRGKPGDGRWKSDLPEVNKVTGNASIPFKGGFPDFSKWTKGKFSIKNLTGTSKDFDLVYKELMKKKGFTSMKAAKQWLKDKGLTPHHHQNGLDIDLVPTALHKNIPHIGGASRLRALFGL